MTFSKGVGDTGRISVPLVSKILAELPVHPEDSAVHAGLRYVTDSAPGLTRRRAGAGFAYYDSGGRAVRDAEILRRIHSLVIPPAWTGVWISLSPRGHLQATGRDTRGRKQYRYHPLYRQIRDQTKFGRMIAFAAALPLIRGRVEEDLHLPGLPKRKVVAAVVRLLETTLIRVGNPEYAKDNNSFGLTTLRDRHVEISGHRLYFKFRGKSGQNHGIELTDVRLSRIVKQCKELPGYELFQYIDDAGEVSQVDSGDVNEYLREITGEDFTSKDFRTWAGTLLAARTLVECGACDSITRTKKNIVATIKVVSGQLGNRPATCRKYYIHPAVLDAYSDGVLIGALRHNRAIKMAQSLRASGLTTEELCVMALIRQSLDK
jgi:DNA topoisomerase-1